MEKILVAFERKGKYGNYYSGTFKNEWVNITKGTDGKFYMKKQDKSTCGMLWVQNSKKGTKFFSGYFGTYDNKVVGFINKSKNGQYKYITIYKAEHKQEPRAETKTATTYEDFANLHDVDF